MGGANSSKVLHATVIGLALAAASCYYSSCYRAQDRALADAIASNRFDDAKKALAAGGRIDYRWKPDRESTLMAMSTSADTPAVEFLIENGADVNLRSGRGFTPIMYAALNGQIANLRLLANAGANVNAVADEGQTAVSIAKAGKHEEAVDELLRLGARDVEAKGMW